MFILFNLKRYYFILLNIFLICKRINSIQEKNRIQSYPKFNTPSIREFSNKFLHHNHHQSIKNIIGHGTNLKEVNHSLTEHETTYKKEYGTFGIGHTNNIIQNNLCPGCFGSTQQKIFLNEQLKNLRLERIKEKILEKLRLKEPPIISKIPLEIMLPHQFLHYSLNGQQNRNLLHSSNTEMDDYYGKTDQIILFPQDYQEYGCIYLTRPSILSTCLTFQLQNDLIKENVDFKVKNAELWIYTFGSSELMEERTFTVGEVIPSNFYIGLKYISLDPKHITNNTEGWEKLDVSATITSWINKTILSRTYKSIPSIKLQISCKNCSRIGSFTSPIDLTKPNNKPFLVIRLAETVQKNRRRRNTNCHSYSLMSQCCRESFKVSFIEIGWHWILEPKEFDAYYCKGTCQYLTGMNTRHQRSSFIQAQTNSMNINLNRSLDAIQQALIPCCTPTKFTSISILYTIDNDTIVHRDLPNMVVDSCGCSIN